MGGHAEKYTLPCGCKVNVDSILALEWTFCPLHEAAPVLAEACREAIESSAPSILGHHAISQQAMMLLHAAFKKALPDA